MADEMRSHHDLQNRANAQAKAIPTCEQALARDTKGAEAANIRHVARQDEMGKRPTQLVRLESPLLKGKKQVDTVAGQFERVRK